MYLWLIAVCPAYYLKQYLLQVGQLYDESWTVSDFGHEVLIREQSRLDTKSTLLYLLFNKRYCGPFVPKFDRAIALTPRQNNFSRKPEIINQLVINLEEPYAIEDSPVESTFVQNSLNNPNFTFDTSFNYSSLQLRKDNSLRQEILELNSTICDIRNNHTNNLQQYSEEAESQLRQIENDFEAEKILQVQASQKREKEIKVEFESLKTDLVSQK